MSYKGDIRLGATIEFTFTTRRFTTGVPFALAGTPSMEVYQTGSSVPITAGITLTVDYSGVTGLNHVSIVATSGNGFATAKDVSVVIAAGTVDSVSVVGETVASFSIENRSALMPTTAARTLDVSAGGEAGIDWANIGSPTTAQNLSGTATATVTTATTATNLTNAPTNGDFTATMKTSIGTAVAASAVASVTAPVTAGTVTDKTGYALSATGSAALTEGYPADGGTGTLPQILYNILQHLEQSAIAGTTKTVLKRDKSTTAATYTLDDAVNPTSITRAT